MPKAKEIDLAEVLANTGSEEWNKCINSRLEAMRSYLAQEQWQKGIAVYLKATLGASLGLFIRHGGKKEYRESGASDYLRGYAAAIELLLALPASVEGTIQRAEKEAKPDAPKGDAGY